MVGETLQDVLLKNAGVVFLFSRNGGLLRVCVYIYTHYKLDYALDYFGSNLRNNT